MSKATGKKSGAGGTKGAGTRPNATFYHYTDCKGALQIATSGKIRPSTNTVRDAVAGPGVYLTKMGPSHNQKTIAKNNWGARAGPPQLGKGKTDAVIAVKLPRKDVKKVDERGRSVYVVPNKSINLAAAKQVNLYTANSRGKYKKML